MAYARHDGTEVFTISAINIAYYPVPNGVVMHLIADLPGPAVFVPNVHLRVTTVNGEQFVDLEAN